MHSAIEKKSIVTAPSIQITTNLSILPLGNVFQAIVSVMAVKIQFNSPNIVRLSLNCPGTLQNSWLSHRFICGLKSLLFNEIQSNIWH